jgi:hypothetical protein
VLLSSMNGAPSPSSLSLVRLTLKQSRRTRMLVCRWCSSIEIFFSLLGFVSDLVDWNNMATSYLYDTINITKFLTLERWVNRKVRSICVFFSNKMLLARQQQKYESIATEICTDASLAWLSEKSTALPTPNCH